MSYVHSSRTTDESLLQESKRFRSLCRLRIPVNIVPRTPVMLGPRLYSRIETARHLVRSDFFAKIDTKLWNMEASPQSKKTKLTKFKKNTHTHTNTSLSLSLYLSIRRCNVYFDVPAPVSLSLSLSLYICKHGLDPDQTRMVFRIECFVNLKSVNTVECPTLSYKSRCAWKVWVWGPHRKQL